MANYGISSSEEPSSGQAMYFEGFEDAGSAGFSTQFDGDFYREPDNTVRGVTLSGVADMHHHSMPGLKGFSGYEDSVEVTRGVTLGGGFPGGSLSWAKIGFDDECGTLPFKYGDEGVGLLGQSPVYQQPTEFAEDMNPPEAPVDPFFHLAVTTILVKLVAGQTPAFIGNLILNFLNFELNSSITKVRTQKFWIKADVFVKTLQYIQFAMCTLKVRIYKAADESYAVEFTKRGGDSVVFNTVFHQAISFFKSRLTVIGDVGDMTPPPPPLLPGFGLLPMPSFWPADPDSDVDMALPAPEHALGPVLDMTSQPSMQAESAATLAGIAEQGEKEAAELCTDAVFQAVRRLLEVKATEAAFPTARLLYRLAYCQQAAPLFTDVQFLFQIIDKVRLAQESLVSGQLAQVLKVSAELWADKLAAPIPLAQKAFFAVEEVANIETKTLLTQAAQALRGAAKLA